MILKLWKNLLRFAIQRALNGLNEALKAGYRFFAWLLRKANRRLLGPLGLARLFNKFFPCPQMVHRYIDARFTVEGFFAVLNQRGVRYAILRGFEDLPDLKPGDDIDLLVHDDDLLKIKDLFTILPPGIPCDVYSVSPLAGTSYCKGIPAYPSHLAREILETSVLYKDRFRVPDPKRHFFSLAYHAVYHKPEVSGLTGFAADCSERSYSKILVTLGSRVGFEVVPDLESLHRLLTEHGWAPRLDVLRRLASDRPTLAALIFENPAEHPLGTDILTYAFDVHGVTVRVESNSAEMIDYVRRDFCFFHAPELDRQRPDVYLRFLKAAPPWEEIPRSAIPLYRTSECSVYKQGGRRYIDHGREILSIYDPKYDEGTIYSNDPDALYRTAYAILMTRIGLRLDAKRLHRIHALAITVNEQALLFLGDGGLGKTTLGLEMMKNPRVGWLTDDILPVDRDAVALALPTSPRLIEGSPVPWLPPAVKLLKSPMPKDPPKLQVPASSFLPRVRPSAHLGALFLCSRNAGVEPSIRPAGFFEAFRGLCYNALTGREFGHMIAYHLEFSPRYACRMALMYLSRIRTFIRLARMVPVFNFKMSGNIAENAEMILEMYPPLPQDEKARHDIPPVERHKSAKLSRV